MLLHDVAAVLISQVLYASTIRLMLRKDGAYEVTHSDKASITMLSRIYTDMIAIRVLVLAGLDPQARQLCRTLSENIDALQLAGMDEEFGRQFVEKQDTDNNEVWFRYIAKGKAARRVHQTIENKTGPGSLREWWEFKQREEGVLSLAAHPSHVGGVVSLLPHLGDTTAPEGDLAERDVTSASLRTLSYSALRALEYLTNDLIHFERVDRIGRDLPEESAGIDLRALRKGATAGRSVALGLMGYLMDHQDDYDPPVDLSALEELQHEATA